MATGVTMVSTWLLFIGVAMVQGEDFSLEYFVDVTIHCNPEGHNFTSTSPIVKTYWLFPDGSLTSSVDDDKHYTINANNSLTLRSISDSDFGYYYCMLVRQDHTLDKIRFGLNVGGANFDDLLEEYKQNAIRGGIAAAILFAFLAGSCILWNLRYHKRDQRNKAVDRLDSAIEGYDLKAYDNVAIETDTQANNLDNKL